MNQAHADYLTYLQTRSRVGHAYRRYWLYPRLCRALLGRVLDVGCGIGDMLAFRPNTVGVDVNPHAVQAAQRRGLEARVMEPDCLPFEGGIFDGVVLDNVLEHIDSPQPLLREIQRVLARNGTLLIGVPGRKGFRSDPDHKVFYDLGHLTQCLGVADFELERHFHMPLPLKWLDERASQYCLYGIFRSVHG